MIIDSFPGFNELALANFRIKYLSDLIDFTIIAESDLTHSGRTKELIFKSWHSSLPSSLKNKIIIIKVDLSNLTDSWAREIKTRETIMEFLRANFPSAKFILSDLDEIPSRGQVETLLKSSGIFHFSTPTFYRKINWALQDSHANWSRGVMGDISKAKYTNGARFEKNLQSLNSNPGAHFSYLGADSNLLTLKLQSLAHIELQNATREAKTLIEICDKYKLDHLGRYYSSGFGLLKPISILENDVVKAISEYLPQVFQDNSTKNPSRFRRHYYSALITTFYELNFVKDISDIGILRLCLTFSKGLLYALRRFCKKIMRQNVRRSLFPSVGS